MRSKRVLTLVTSFLAAALLISTASACPISKLFHPHSDDSTSTQTED